eukprot:CAMPEP_0171188632 /NCGR_PEP_ID=MMETSP0790-20130122/17934_1 /TAXON_ID=2925 /ORGANISM="Alexandrium catenella, Strain OF101" /LENGTH=123 /DNA_ID=CAMNT_0011653725 /DNA_START=296 /DNA_END=667 /DNA_ORIENTATION=-
MPPRAHRPQRWAMKAQGPALHRWLTPRPPPLRRRAGALVVGTAAVAAPGAGAAPGLLPSVASTACCHAAASADSPCEVALTHSSEITACRPLIASATCCHAVASVGTPCEAALIHSSEIAAFT